MERYCIVRTAVQTLQKLLKTKMIVKLLQATHVIAIEKCSHLVRFVVNVFPVPKIIVHMTRYQMMFRKKGKKSASTS